MLAVLRGGLALGVALSCAAAARAQIATPPAAPPHPAAERTGYQVTYDHLTGGVVEVRNDKGKLVGYSPGSALRIPADRSLTVVIVNANSLLYTYEVTAPVVAERRVTACGGVLTRYISKGLVSAVGLVGAGVEPAVLAAKFLKTSTALPAETERGAGKHYTITTLNQTLERIRNPVNQYIAFTSAVASLARTLEDSLARIAELGEETPIEPLLEGLQRAADHLAAGLHEPTQVEPLLHQRVDSEAGTALSELAQVKRALEAGDVDGGPATPAALDARALVAATDSAGRTLSSASRQLRHVLHRIDTAERRSKQTFAFGPSGDLRRLVIVLHATSDRDLEALPRVREGSSALDVEPTVGVICQVSVGIAWMSTPPLYAIENSALVNRADNTRVAPSLAFGVAAPGFPILGPLVGIGVGVNHRPDLYAGASLRMLQPVLLNAGVVWQYTPQLPPGVALGQTISDPTLLHRLALSYEAHAFFGLSFAP